MKRQLLSIFVAICCFVTCIPVTVSAKDIFVNTTDGINSVGEIGGYLVANVQTVKRMEIERRFLDPKGWGFAAEEANNLIDNLKGKKSVVVGYDNATNGPDRLIRNKDKSITLIQDKYYKSAKESVNAAFDEKTSMYRYKNSDGSPMKLEVPADQYEQAVKIMEEKIKDNKVEGVTDVAEAKNIVKKGNVTYKQAKNIAKAGNVDSLMYDAANGAIYATSAMGITFVLDYAVCKLNGLENKEALHTAGMDCLKSGTVVFASYVITSQLAKAGAGKAMAPMTDAIVKHFGPNVKKAIVDAYGVRVKSSIDNQVSQILQNTLLTDGVVIVVLSSADIFRLFKGRISAQQFAKNLAVTVASVAGTTVGGVAGNALGNAIAPGIGGKAGKFIGGTFGGLAAGVVSEHLLSKWYEGDAQIMYDIISSEFQILSKDYMINQEEADAIVDELKKQLDSGKLKDMYESENREEFADKFMEPIFEKAILQRETIHTPNEIETRTELLASLEGIIFVH